MNINKLTKAQLIEHVQQVEETKYDNLKVATGMPYNTDEDWIAYIQKLQDLNAERLVDCENLVKLVEVFMNHLIIRQSCIYIHKPKLPIINISQNIKKLFFWYKYNFIIDRV